VGENSPVVADPPVGAGIAFRTGQDLGKAAVQCRPVAGQRMPRGRDDDRDAGRVERPKRIEEQLLDRFSFLKNRLLVR
jgi:hypothetical protein